MQPNQTFFQKNKKEIIISALALIAFILVGYFLFLNKKNTTNEAGGGTLTQNNTFLNNLFSNVSDIFDNENGNTDQNEENLTNESLYIEGLIKIWKEPVAGYGIGEEFFYETTENENGDIMKEKYKKNVLYFVDSKSGYIYKKDLWVSTSTPTQITDSSSPNISKAYFMNDSQNITSRVIMQYIEDNGAIKTFTAKIPGYFGAPSKLISLTPLPDNIINISVSDDGKKVIYIIKKAKNTNGKTDYYTDWYLISNYDDVYGKKIYTSELSNWKSSINNDGTIYANQSSTAYEESSLYRLNINNSVLENIYQGHTGTGFKVNGKNIFVSIFTGSGIKTFINQNFNSGGFLDANLSGLNFNTLSEKCTISDNLQICGVPKEIKNYDAGLPDAWYQGFTTWSDDLYVINEDYPFGAKLFDFKIDGEVYDIIDSKDLKINSFLTHLIFINKNDGSLWSLNINNILPTTTEFDFNYN